MTASPTDSAHPRTALVTGGGGFLGRAIVEQLLARGDRVRSFARGQYPQLATLGVQVIQGDLADAAAVRNAVHGCDLVFHVAAKAGLWGRYDDYHRPNVIGTENVIAACRAEHVPHLIYTGSPSVVFDGTDIEGVDESAPYPAHYHSDYSKTKAIAEQAVLAANDDHRLATIALRPHLIWGPRDNHIIPRLINRARAGQLRIIGDGKNQIDTIYIDNAAEAHLLAADALRDNPAAAGRAYFISQGAPVLAWQFINQILETADLPPITRSSSRRSARTIGAILETTHTLFRIKAEPKMTRFLADELATSHFFDISAARSQLRYTPRISTDEGLQRLRTWFQNQNGLPN